MALNLPKPIDNYFTADTTNGEAIANCFTVNATVRDEERIHTGHDEIKHWVENSAKEYSFVSEPFAIEELEGSTIVTSKVSGTFPGSPIDLKYNFKLEGDKIAYLEITG